MLRLLANTAQACLVALISYNALSALWGWKDRLPAPTGIRERRLRVVVPAHNEASVIGGILQDLERSTYQPIEIWVIADRCTDSTAAIARRHQAEIAERHTGASGKGAALGWYLSEHPLDPDETLVVFDADNRIEPETLSRIADELDDGHDIVQCYLDIANPDQSAIAQASALSYWAGNRMVQLARSNLGWSADLGGTGMALTAKALESVGGFSESLTEDQDLAAALVVAGHRVEWLHDVRIHDQKPDSVGVTVRQRARWMAGKRATRRKYVVPLIKSGRPAGIDQAVRLLQPGRSFMALVSAGLTFISALGATWVFPWQFWGALTVLQVVEPLPFLAKEGVPPKHLAKYPALALLAALWVPIRLLSSRTTSWYHTPHESSSVRDR